MVSCLRHNFHTHVDILDLELERRLLSEKGFDFLLEASYQAEAVKWCNVLKRIIDSLFLGERGLAFSGS